MTERLAVAALWACLVVWLLFRAVRQMRFYTVLDPAGEAMPARDDVAVIVPVRNEARAIARCLHGLLAQDYPASG